jgi:hypothetical protein
MDWVGYISRFWQLDAQRRATLLEAAWTLVAARLAVRWLPFRWIVPRLGRPLDAGPDVSITPEQLQQALQVGWAIQTLLRLPLWNAQCLAQAVAGKWMLQRRSLSSTLYLGVDRGQQGWLDAHAWLCCGSEIITGEPEHERFKVIATFTEGRK